MDDTVAELLVLALRALFELLVPHSLGLATREILIALCLAGALWLFNRVRALWVGSRLSWVDPSQAA